MMSVSKGMPGEMRGGRKNTGLLTWNKSALKVNKCLRSPMTFSLKNWE